MLIRKLEFILENCEIVTIDGKYIEDFYVGDIKKEIARMACNHIGMEEICHSFCVKIHKDANKKYAPFGESEWETFTFDRLTKYNDITSVGVYEYADFHASMFDIGDKYWAEHEEMLKRSTNN